VKLGCWPAWLCMTTAVDPGSTHLIIRHDHNEVRLLPAAYGRHALLPLPRPAVTCSGRWQRQQRRSLAVTRCRRPPPARRPACRPLHGPGITPSACRLPHPVRSPCSHRGSSAAAAARPLQPRARAVGRLCARCPRSSSTPAGPLTGCGAGACAKFGGLGLGQGIAKAGQGPGGTGTLALWAPPQIQGGEARCIAAAAGGASRSCIVPVACDAGAWAGCAARRWQEASRPTPWMAGPAHAAGLARAHGRR